MMLALNQAPEEELNEARLNITKAKKMHAPDYATKCFETAERYFDSAMVSWSAENEILILFRRYDEVVYYARKASETAREAMQQTLDRSSAIRDQVQKQIASVQKQYAHFEKRFGTFPYGESNRTDLATGKLLLGEADRSLKQENLHQAALLTDSAGSIIKQLTAEHDRKLEAYLSNYPVWRKWVDSTIELTAKNRSRCIIIDKLARQCLLYDRGTLVDTFPVELGINWIGDKQSEGDRATPEGNYRIVSLKNQGETRYHKALLLDYPNEDDKKRFQRNKQNGTIGQQENIGGMIEIHGHGDKGIDWTDGCVALANRDMDRLFKFVQPGTLVTIVGTARSPEHTVNPFQ